MTAESIKSSGDSSRSVLIAGMGNAGCNAVSAMHRDWGLDRDIVLFNTDSRGEDENGSLRSIVIGGNVTRGFGAGGNVKVGRRAAELSIDLMRDAFAGRDLVVFVAGMGGGTGTGALPVAIRAARDANALSLTICMMPFGFEGNHRNQLAEEGLKEIESLSTCTIVMKNQKLFDAWGGDVDIRDAFSRSDDILGSALFGLWNVVSTKGLMSLDFSNLRGLLDGAGKGAGFGFGRGSGEQRCEKAIENLKTNPLLVPGKGFAESQSVVLSVMGGVNLSLLEVDRIVKGVDSLTAEGSVMSTGVGCDERLGEDVMITVFWSGTPPEPQIEKPSVSVPAAEAPSVKSATRKQVRKKGGKQDTKLTQGTLFEDSTSQGRFKDVEPTIHEGSNLDIPTFKRKGVTIQRLQNTGA